MIRITTQGRYALRAMVDLAVHAGDGPVARADIADRQGISSDYVAQLFHKLQAAGLVEGYKGPGGGYRLAREAPAIRAGDVVRAVEGPVVLAPCMESGCEPCSRLACCETHLFWSRLSEMMTAFLDATTLQDLVEEAQQ
ncbi:MAG: Rrf2 family transcriptional regulator [Anaerolineae bacterium]